MKKKILALTLVFALALALGIGGTVAWLTAKTDSVVNTFTVGDINITLTESGATGNAKNYTFVPGDKLAKDPMVTVLEGSEACYLFVKIDAENNSLGAVDPILTWNPADGWTKLVIADTGEDTEIYYRQVNAVPVDADDTTKGQEFYVLAGEGTDNYKNGYVTVSTELTKAQVNNLNNDKPTLTFTAYAIQSANLADTNTDGKVDAVDAWALVKAG